jgi:coiled-coil and C2 domain-containing protein 1
MFGGKKQNEASKKPRRSTGTREKLQNLGLVPDIDNIGGANPGGDSDDEADLEAELQSLMYGGSKTKAKPKKNKKAAPNLDSMVAACMEDLPSDADEELDHDDPDLLDELAQFEEDDDEEDDVVVVMPEQAAKPKPKPSTIKPQIEVCQDQSCAGQSLLSIIESRITMYSLAETKAKEAGEVSRARRFTRGLTTLTDLRRKVKSGKAVNEDDIPPVISSATSSATSSQVTSPKEERVVVVQAVLPPVVPPHRLQPQDPQQPRVQPQVPTQPRVPPPVPVQQPPVPERRPEQPPEQLQPQQVQRPPNPVIQALQEKRSTYKSMALQFKKDGDRSMALFGLQGVKQCDELIQKVSNGEEVNLDTLPAMPGRKQPIGMLYVSITSCRGT